MQPHEEFKMREEVQMTWKAKRDTWEKSEGRKVKIIIIQEELVWIVEPNVIGPAASFYLAWSLCVAQTD